MKLTLTEVDRSFDDEPVLDGVSIAVKAGEVVAIIGPSGAGKTTLLRVASCFAPPDAGSVAIADVDPWAQPTARRRRLRRRIGVVFQQASLFETSVERNVNSGLRFRRPWPARLRRAARRLLGRGRVRNRLLGRPPAVDAERVDAALSLVGLTNSRTRDARLLSGGEAQRVAFARAIAYEPDLLVLDEPTSDLDPRNTAILEHAIDRACDRGHGVLLATHDMHQARRIADRVAVLVDGELIEVGPPTQIFESPADPRTRRFVDGDLLYDVDSTDAVRDGPSATTDVVEHPSDSPMAGEDD